MWRIVLLGRLQKEEERIIKEIFEEFNKNLCSIARKTMMSIIKREPTAIECGGISVIRSDDEAKTNTRFSVNLYRDR